MSSRWFWFLATVMVVVIIGIVGSFTFFGYVWHSVGEQELGVETIAGRVTKVVGPGGIHSNTALWADLHDVNISQLPWCSVDPEVLTSDQQRLGFVVCGTVQRPDQSDLTEDKDSGKLENHYIANDGDNWVSYKQYYIDDRWLAGEYHMESDPSGTGQIYAIDQAGLMQTLAQQSMKSCVGDMDFDQAVVGSSRDELLTCIKKNLTQLSSGYGGLKVANVVVPNVILGSGVQQKFDEITLEKFNTQLAEQKAELAKAQAKEQLAIEQGKIQVEEGRLQEEARQKEQTAELQARAEEARRELIQAQKENDIFAADYDLKVAEIKLEAAKLEAQQNNAWDVILSQLLADYPEYADYLMLKAAVDGWKDLDKVIVPAGTDPMTIINPWGGSNNVLVNPGE